MSNYRYNEPQENEYEPIPEGDYDFGVTSIEPTYTNDRGTFILPVEIRLVGTERKIKQWLSAGTSIKGKPFDMISPFLKSIRRNPAVGEEPDFSSRNLIGASGKAHVREEPYTGENEKYKGKTFPSVAWWIYDREQTATVSGGQTAQDRTYGKSLPASSRPPLKPAPEDDGDSIPF